MIYLQIATALFAFACAWLNKVPVEKMINHGASIHEEREFHSANAVIKMMFGVLAVAALRADSIVHVAVALVLFGLIQWLVFDIALNGFVKGWGHWDYIGTTAKIDRALHKLFPHGDAGEVKAIACVLLIITINIIYHFL
jgi:hypothetical protein